MIPTAAVLLAVLFGLGLMVAARSRPRLAVAPRTLTAAALTGALLLAGCAQLGPVLAAAAQGAQYLGTVLDVAEAGADAYLARHPHQSTEEVLDDAERYARQALATYNAMLTMGEAVDQGELEQARLAAVDAYDELYSLLDTLGVLRARAPDGGAETSAPLPQPLQLPPPNEVEARTR